MTDLSPKTPEIDLIPKILTRLKKDLDPELLKIIFGVDNRIVNGWIKGTRKVPPHVQTVIFVTDQILDILQGSKMKDDYMLWLVSESNYLYGIPVLELKKRPQDVYLASLNYVTRGEQEENHDQFGI